MRISTFNDAIERLNAKFDSCLSRLERRFKDAIMSIKETVIKRLQDNDVLRKRLREVEIKLEKNSNIR